MDSSIFFFVLELGVYVCVLLKQLIYSIVLVSGVQHSDLGILQICCCLVAKSCLTRVIPQTVAHQAPLSMEFPRQQYWSGLPILSPGDLPRSLALAGGVFTTEPPGKSFCRLYSIIGYYKILGYNSLCYTVNLFAYLFYTK